MSSEISEYKKKGKKGHFKSLKTGSEKCDISVCKMRYQICVKPYVAREEIQWR